MLRTIIFSLLLSLGTCLLLAQSIPEFSFTLYLSDGLGRQDSVVLGYDSLATYGIDPNFGEVDISQQPFDTAFEVRTYDSPVAGPTDPQTKTNIVPLEYGEFTQNWDGYAELLIRIKHPPLTFRWDSSLFRGSTYAKHGSSLLVSNNYYFAAPGPDYFPQFLRATDVFQEFFSVPNYEYQSYWDQDAAGDSARIYIYHFAFLGKDLLVSIDAAEEIAWQVYPNPAQRQVQVQADMPLRELRVYDALGRLVKRLETSPLRELRFSVAELPTGWYFLRGQTVDGQGLHARLRVAH